MAWEPLLRRMQWSLKPSIHSWSTSLSNRSYSFLDLGSGTCRRYSAVHAGVWEASNGKKRIKSVGLRCEVRAGGRAAGGFAAGRITGTDPHSLGGRPLVGHLGSCLGLSWSVLFLSDAWSCKGHPYEMHRSVRARGERAYISKSKQNPKISFKIRPASGLLKNSSMCRMRVT